MDRVDRQAQLLEDGETEQDTVARFAEDHAARRRFAIDRDDRVTDLAGGAA